MSKNSIGTSMAPFGGSSSSLGTFKVPMLMTPVRRTLGEQSQNFSFDLSPLPFPPN